MLMAYWLQWPDLFGIPEVHVEVTRSICVLITLYVPNCLEDIKVWFSQIFIHGAYIYHLDNDCWWPRPSLPVKVRKPRVRCAWNCRLQLRSGRKKWAIFWRRLNMHFLDIYCSFYRTSPLGPCILHGSDLTTSSQSPGGDRGISLNCNVYKHWLPGCQCCCQVGKLSEPGASQETFPARAPHFGELNIEQAQLGRFATQPAVGSWLTPAVLLDGHEMQWHRCLICPLMFM